MSRENRWCILLIREIIIGIYRHSGSILRQLKGSRIVSTFLGKKKWNTYCFTSPPNFKLWLHHELIKLERKMGTFYLMCQFSLMLECVLKFIMIFKVKKKE